MNYKIKIKRHFVPVEYQPNLGMLIAYFHFHDKVRVVTYGPGLERKVAEALLLKDCDVTPGSSTN